MGKRTEHFFKDIQMANRYMKRYSILLMIREMQIKTKVSCNLIIRMAIMQSTS